MQPLAAHAKDEASGTRETKSDTNLRGLLQHTLSSLAMGWPLKAWGRRRSSRSVQSADSGVEEEVAPFVSDRSLFTCSEKSPQPSVAALLRFIWPMVQRFLPLALAHCWPVRSESNAERASTPIVEQTS
jgi:hypothetical protein